MTKIFARIADNVLDPIDWPVRVLYVDANGVVTYVEEKDGAYAWSWSETSPDVGWTLGQVAAWTCFDATGSHPEVYHQVLDKHGEWVDYATVEDIV